jgi:hypothetical protein
MDNYGYHTTVSGVKGDRTQVIERTKTLVPLEDAKAQLIKAIEEADEGTTLSLSLHASQWH